MSQENVEVARSSFEAWQNDDYETWIALQDADVEYLGAVERRLGQGVYLGHKGASKLWRLWRDEVEGFWIESQEIRDLGDGRILHLGQMGFRGSASGVEVDSQLALVITLRDGKIVRSMDFMSHHEALQAVRLAE
jgi:ketosteroid isomerase-like protein